jgi:hypothetical protein
LYKRTVISIISHPYYYYQAYIDPHLPLALFTLKMVSTVYAKMLHICNIQCG